MLSRASAWGPLRGLGAVVALVVVLAGCGGGGGGTRATSGGGAQKVRTVKVGFIAGVNAPLFIARDQKLFEKAGVKPYLIRFDSGAAIFPALRSGSIDVADFSNIAYASAAAQGLKPKIFRVLYDISSTNQLLVKKGSSIKTAADLKGKKVGSVKASSAYYGLVTYLKQNNMTLHDIQFVSLDPKSLVPAFQAGDVDAVYAFSPQSTQLVSRGAVPIVSNADTGAPGVELWVARPEWLAGNADVAARLDRAYEQAVELVGTPDGKDVAAKALVANTGVTDDVARALVGDVTFPTAQDMMSSDSPYSMVNQSGGLADSLQKVATFLKEAGLIGPADVNGVIDVGPVKASATGSG